jgi:hypothetical protein
MKTPIVVAIFALSLTVSSFAVDPPPDGGYPNNNTAEGEDAIRIGKQGTQSATYIAGISGATVAGGVAVIIDTSGHLGTVTSSNVIRSRFSR